MNDFVAQLELGLAKWAFERKDYVEAERRFRSTCESHPDSGAAPEACYWAGVSSYKATHAPRALADTATILKARYPESEWAKKASVWAG